METRKVQRSAINRSADVIALHTLAYLFCGMIAIACLLPFIMVVSASFSSEMAV